MENNGISCKDVMEHICENLIEQIDTPKCREIKAHLQTCDNCRNYFSNVDDTINLFRHCSEELPAGAHNRLANLLGLDE